MRKRRVYERDVFGDRHLVAGAGEEREWEGPKVWLAQPDPVMMQAGFTDPTLSGGVDGHQFGARMTDLHDAAARVFHGEEIHDVLPALEFFTGLYVLEGWDEPQLSELLNTTTREMLVQAVACFRRAAKELDWRPERLFTDG